MSAILSVSELNSYIGNRLDNDPHLNNISVRGEISNCNYSSSGHIYFSVKDSGSQLSCALFRNRLSSLKFRLTDGMSVILTGSINVYVQGGRYSLIVESVEQEGTGALYEQYEKLKNKLYAEGLFDESHKKAIPRYVRTVGVVTSRTGAVLHDIINVTKRRNPYVDIILSPAAVQGTGAALTLIGALKKLEAARPDVIIIGRGGGSFEDLFEFNDENLARTIFSCEIPVISAVGHEVDHTICDLVSDLRAPTPSAAAELAVFDVSEVQGRLVDCHAELMGLMIRKINSCRNRLDICRLKLDRRSPKARLADHRQRLDRSRDRLTDRFHKLLDRRKKQLELYIEKLEGVSPLRRLQSGYAYISDDNEHNVKSVSAVHADDIVHVRVTDGSFDAKVTGIYPD